MYIWTNFWRRAALGFLVRVRPRHLFGACLLTVKDSHPRRIQGHRKTKARLIAVPAPSGIGVTIHSAPGPTSAVKVCWIAPCRFVLYGHLVPRSTLFHQFEDAKYENEKALLYLQNLPVDDDDWIIPEP